MNPYKLREIYKYLTRAKKIQPDLPDVFPASKAPIPAKTQNVQEIEAINRFTTANPRIEKAGGGRIGYADGPPGFQPGNQMNLRRRDGNPGNIQALEKIMKEKTAVKDKKVNKFVELVEKGDTTTEAKNKVIQLFKLDRSKKAGTPPWMTQGKNILIDKGILKSKEKTTQETLGKTENLTSNQDIKKIDTQVKRPAPNIKEVKYKNIKTGETFSRFKPVIGESNKTVSGSGFKTLKEAKKIVDNYFKKNPKQIRVRDPQKNYDTKDRRAKALEETDRTKAAGTKKYNYHHIRQIAGGVPLTTDDVMIINQRINSKIGGKFNESLNRISTAIQKNNKLALEAMNNKQEGLALDYMKRSDELNAQAEKIVNSAIDDLPEKYKSYVGFNKFTLPRDEYGLPISNEPMIIKKVGGMPVSKDAIDLTTLDLKQEKEFRKIVKAQAERGKIGSIKKANILSAFCGGRKKLNTGSGSLSCSMEEIQTNMKKQINEAARASKDGKIPKRFGKLRAVAGGFFGDVALPLEYMFMAPDLVAGDIDGALRSSTAGLFGAGKVDLEQLPPGEGRKYIRHKNAITNFLNNYQSKLIAEDQLKNLKPGDEEQFVITDQLAQAEKNMADIVKDYQGFGYTYQPGEKGLLEGKVAAQKLIRDKVTSDFNKKIDGTADYLKGGEFFKDSNKDLLKDNLRSLGGDPFTVTPINNLEDYIKNKGEATAGNTNILFNRLPYTLEQAEAYGVPDIFNTYAGGYAGVETPGSMEEGQEIDMGIKDVRDAYSSLPINMASQLAALEKKEFEEGMIKKDLQQRLAGGGIAKLAGVSSGVAPVSGPNPQGLLSLKNRVRNY